MSENNNVFCKKATKAAEIRKAENPDKSKVFGVFAGVPGGIRTHGLSLRSRPDTMKPSATQCKKILGNTRLFTVSNPIWYYAS